MVNFVIEYIKLTFFKKKILSDTFYTNETFSLYCIHRDNIPIRTRVMMFFNFTSCVHPYKLHVAESNLAHFREDFDNLLSGKLIQAFNDNGGFRVHDGELGWTTSIVPHTRIVQPLLNFRRYLMGRLHIHSKTPD